MAVLTSSDALNCRDAVCDLSGVNVVLFQVWSQEAFCHCMDQKALMKEVSRVLKPGGVIVFSDIMQGDGGGDCTSFTGQNVVASMASPLMYKVCTHHMHCLASRHRRAHAYLHCEKTPLMIDRGRYGEHCCRHSAPLWSLSFYLIPRLTSSVDLVAALGANSTDDVLWGLSPPLPIRV